MPHDAKTSTARIIIRHGQRRIHCFRPTAAEKETTTFMLISTGIQNTKTRPPLIDLYRNGVSNLSKNCTCGISTGTPSNCGTSTVVCTVTTKHQSFCHQLVQELHLWELVNLLNSTEK